MLCIHNNSLMLNHIFAFTLPEIQDVSKKGTFPDFDVPFPVTGTGMTNSNPIFGNGNGNENSIKFHSLFREREWEWKIPFPTFGTGIGGRYTREFPGSGIPAHGWEKEDEKFQRNSERRKSRTRCEAKDDDVGTECASSSPLYVPSSSSPLNVQPICQSSLELHQPFINVVCC